MTELAEPMIVRRSAGPGLDELVDRRAPGMTLEAPFYIDDGIFASDVAVIFGRHWIFVATESEIPEAGDFVTVDVGPSSVILVRDDDEEVRALRNVCRHRGSRVLHESRGSVGNIVCGYHQWTYAPDGELMHAGQQAEGFDKSCFGLKPVNVRSVEGLIFICLAADPPADFDEVAARVRPYLAPHQVRHTKVAAQEDLVEHANWKLVMENNRECYHCEAGHPELTCTFFPTYGYEVDQIPKRLLPAHARFVEAGAELQHTCEERGIPYALIEELSGRPTAFRLQREPLDGAGESYTLDGSRASHKLLGELDTFRMGRLSMHWQPNAWFHLLGDHVVTFSVLPLAADRTLVRTTWLVHEDAVEGVDYDVGSLTQVWHATNAQDGALVARAQVGVTDPAYESGPYAPAETQVDEFDTWYVERMKEHLGR